MQLAVNDGVIAAINFSIGALLVEIAYVRISLVGIAWVQHQKILFRWLEWIGVVLVLILAIGSFISAASPSGTKPVLLESDIPRILLGVGMSALNPMQIPFWFGWSSVLLSKKILLPVNLSYNYYVAGIGTGTFLGHLTFILAGTILMRRTPVGPAIVKLAHRRCFCGHSANSPYQDRFPKGAGHQTIALW